MSHAYSDRVNHAFAFAAKYYTPRVRRGSGYYHLTHSANVAIILARYGCDETTMVSGVLANLLEEAEPAYRRPLEHKIAEKFGAMVCAVLEQVVEPRYDARGRERTWEVCKMDYLANMAVADARALEVCAATQIHRCGSTLADIRRLGVEYLSTFSNATAEQTLWWYRSIIEMFERQPPGPRPGMIVELRDLSDRLALELEGEP